MENNPKMFIELGVCVLLSTTMAFVLFELYKWATVNSDYFAKKKLKHLKPSFLLGNTAGLFLKQCNLPEFFDSIYNRYPNEKYVILGSPTFSLSTSF